MRILVYPHSMEIGGSQLGAVQLAAAVRDRGHEVIVFSEPGRLVKRVQELGLEHIEVAPELRHPSVAVLGQLVRTVRRRRIDVVHGYEWPAVVDACLGPWLLRRTPVVATVMSMSVVPFFPRTVPLVVGTEEIRAAALAAGHRRVTLIEPPVDTQTDHPGVDGSDFRVRHGIARDETLIVMVCRLVPELKLEGLLAACDAVGELAAAGQRIRLAIVGDGRARDQIAARARLANATVGNEAVLLTGELDDPAPAYATADAIVGQGSSALRGMAFGKPLVVAGEDGYVELLAPATASLFLRQGWYGRGPGSFGSGSRALREILEHLAPAPELRKELGDFARQLVLARFSLARAAEIQQREYDMALAQPLARGALAADTARCTSGVVRTKLRRKYERRRGVVSVDDANARPLAAAGAA